ncbi:hypothetical protein PILCRDRAFT_540833 [Piloderma croceum F 1598]|uniref:Uncharacterized protein n=1 Tax=Piloderma croceum (strain F 1598) TaxID=765440 RepID=A0A0C3F5E9_PILCF|nr:hypothetical protein PILCRDRAFT_540833 [Piloderma croceum F 1598]
MRPNYVGYFHGILIAHRLSLICIFVLRVQAGALSTSDRTFYFVAGYRQSPFSKTRAKLFEAYALRTGLRTALIADTMSTSSGRPRTGISSRQSGRNYCSRTCRRRKTGDFPDEN